MLSDSDNQAPPLEFRLRSFTVSLPAGRQSWVVRVRGAEPEVTVLTGVGGLHDALCALGQWLQLELREVELAVSPRRGA